MNCLFLTLLSLFASCAMLQAARPNVLFIAVDDLNDWIGCLGGHPQTKTPNLDRLAASGVLFRNACTAAASCNPSRTAVFSGLPPHRSGLYSNLQKMREVLPEAELLPRYFSRHGYWSAGSGKMLHYVIDPPSWDDYFPDKAKDNPFPHTFDPKQRPVNLPRAGPWQYVETDWAALDVTDEEFGGDWSVTKWIGEQLQRQHEQPFFLACGLYRPHEPWFVPKKYFEPFPLDSIQLPPGYKADDLDDVPPTGQKLGRNRYFEHIQKHGQWKKGIQAYLASIHFADAMLGRVLDALESSPQRDNTIVVLWSDHGWHLGEKEHWQKFTGWRACARVPLMIRVPKGVPGLAEGTQAGSVCDRSVSLVDLFTTLTELCGLPEKDGLESRSLVPLLANPSAEWPHAAITHLDKPENYAITTERWRYIHYQGDEEELYDIANDPHEWTNLAAKPEHAAKLAEMRALAPKEIKVTEAAAKKTPASRPNIVLILADDLGYGDVRCYNAESKVPTPHIDRLAGQGMRFTDAHSPATVCTPSRYSLMTGQMAFRVPSGGTVFQGTGGPSLIALGRLTLPAMLKKQGYATAAVGKWHIGLTFRDQAGKAIHSGERAAVQRIDYSRRIEGGPLDHGFDQFFGTACCPTTEWLYAFIDGDHIPVPPTGPIDKSKLPKHPYAHDCRAGFIAPDFPMEEVDMVFLKKSREFIQQHVRESPDKPFFLFHATQAVHLPSFAAPEFKGKTLAGPHGDFIHEFDYIVGELMSTLEKAGIAEETLVILSSDNGPEVASVVHMRADHAHDGAKPWRGIKRDSWEGGHRVPFIVRWPGRVKRGSISDQTICLTDIMATVAAITGTELPHDAAEDSFNMLPVLESKATAPIRPCLITQAFGGARTLSIRRGAWKYLDHRGSGGNNYDQGELKRFALPESAAEAPAQLYDLASDPGETTNLFSQKPEIVKQLKALLEQSKITGRSRP
jgi:arylsulfatase A-like enzyme